MYLEVSQITTMELFCENSWQVKFVPGHFYGKFLKFPEHLISRATMDERQKFSLKIFLDFVELDKFSDKLSPQGLWKLIRAKEVFLI